MKRYTEDQLKDCSKEELIDIVLDVFFSLSQPHLHGVLATRACGQ